MALSLIFKSPYSWSKNFSVVMFNYNRRSMHLWCTWMKPDVWLSHLFIVLRGSSDMLNQIFWGNLPKKLRDLLPIFDHSILWHFCLLKKAAACWLVSRDRHNTIETEMPKLRSSQKNLLVETDTIFERDRFLILLGLI